jgi:penicillin-binding protein 2
MDVNTGAILAMASYPYYDPNVLNPYNNHPLASGSYITDMLNDPRQPFFNRATQGEYPPGSLFKLVTIAAALDSGLFEADSQYTCTGVWAELGEADIRQDWLEGGHGTINLEQALTGSCNPYFYHVGLITGRQDYNLIPRYAVEFGLGRATGIQIEEETGLVPDPDWMQQTRGQEWTLADSVNIAIGQGDYW